MTKSQIMAANNTKRISEGFPASITVEAAVDVLRFAIDHEPIDLASAYLHALKVTKRTPVDQWTPEDVLHEILIATNCTKL